jgi:hypothetical membrane protein
MLTQTSQQTGIPVHLALRWVGVIGGTWAILVVLAAMLAYLPGHPGFSLLATYLSDIGDAAGWPQILFNSGTLIAVPIRYLVVVLLVLRLVQLGAGRAFATAALVVGLVSTAGTAIMTAVPFSVSLSIHKLGIPLYFLGIVVLQTLIGAREWSIRGIPKILPALSFLMVVVYTVFAALMMLYERGAVGRSTPVIWEWLSVLSSVVWLFAQSVVLGMS